MGAIGLALLLIAGALTVVLPVHEELPPQYRIGFGVESATLPEQSHQFGIGEVDKRYTFEFEVPIDDVYEITITYGFADDVVTSEPDQFLLQLEDPEGNFMPPSKSLRNAVATSDPARPGEYVSQPINATYTWSRMAQPQDEVIEGTADSNATAIQQDILKKFHQRTAGTWTLKVVLLTGQCPDSQQAAGSTETAQRAAACVAESQSPNPQVAPQDTGNLFTVEAFTYRSFTVNVERIQ